MRLVVYPDTNTLSYCWEPLPGWTDAGLQRLRSAIINAQAHDKLVVLGSRFHLEGGSRIPEADRRRRFFRFFWDTVRWALLLPTSELVQVEAAVRRPLVANEPFYTYSRRQAIRDWCRDDGNLNDLKLDVQTSVEKFAADHEARRESVQKRLAEAEEYKGLSTDQVTKRWWADSAARIEDWVRDYVRASRVELKLEEDESTWPAPRDLQTAWAIHAYHLARIVMNVGLGRRIGDGDAHDAHHYAGACYGAVFVTNDAAFRETLDLVPARLVDVLSFDQFAKTLGVSPA